MKNKILPKTAALLIFFCGITAFVYHQSGYSSKSSMKFNGSPNGGKVSNQTDSITQTEKDSILLMLSSKTAIITKQETTDTVKDTQDKKTKP